MLKRGSKDKYRALRLCTLCQMFRLLYQFSQGDKKNNFAPQIYKNLAFSLVDNHSDTNTREYIMVNLCKVFEAYPKIPIGMIVEPAVK